MAWYLITGDETKQTVKYVLLTSLAARVVKSKVN